MATTTTLETIAKERQRVQEEIARLQEQDRNLYLEQVKLQTRLKTEDEEAQEKAKFALDPSLQRELEQPVNPFWGADKVALVSYPRSGNSLLRRIVEKLTQTVTGSDARPDRPLVQQLTAMGMRGEGVMDSRVWCVKTHYPERVGRARLVVKRAVLIVRNPFDSIASFFQMMLTDSHTKSVSAEEVRMRFSQLWSDFLFEELSVWMQFHSHWKQIKGVFVVRYEDLVQHRAKTIKEIADFLFRPLYDSGLFTPDEVQSRVDSLTTIPQKDVGLYAPKALNNAADKASTSSNGDPVMSSESTPPPSSSASTTAPSSSSPTLSTIPRWESLDPTKAGYLKALGYFSDEQYRHVLAAARSHLVQFGYWDTCIAARPQCAPDLVPYVDIPPGGCVVEEDDQLRLNSRFALRPRTKQDPYGRGFDVRWEERLNALPKPVSSDSLPKE